MAFLSQLQQENYVKRSGDLIKSKDWNALVKEVIDLGEAKVDRAGDTIQGELRVSGATQFGSTLAVAGKVGIGTADPATQLAIQGGSGTGTAGTTALLRLIRPGTSGKQHANSVDLRVGAAESNIRASTRLDIALTSQADEENNKLGTVPDVTVMTLLGSGNVGIGTTAPSAKLEVNGTLKVSGATTLNDNVTIGTTQSAKNLTVNGNVGIGTMNPRSALDTGKGVMSGAANDYVKAQFTMSGGGIVTWSWNATNNEGRLKWTERFIAIAMERGSSFSNGEVSIRQPTENIPGANVHDGTDRVSTAGVLLKQWEALYAVHTVGGNATALNFQICAHSKTFIAPSNWLLVAVVNGTEGSIKLGTGTIVSANSTWSANAINFKDGNMGIGATSTTAKLTIQGISATGTAGTTELLRLIRPGTSGKQHANSVDLRVGAAESNIRASTRLDIALTSQADEENNKLGTVPDVTVMTLLGSGNVGIGTTAPSAKLEVNGNTKLKGNVTIDSTTTTPSAKLEVNGTTTLRGDVTLSPAGNNTTSNLTVKGNVTIGEASAPKKLEVNGATTLKGDVTVESATTNTTANLTVKGTVKATGATTIDDTLTVAKATTLKGDVTVESATTNTTANLTVKGTVKATGATTIDDTLTVAKATTLKGDVTIDSTTTAKAKLEVIGTLKVSGATTLNDNVTIVSDKKLTFNGSARQVLNLWGENYGIGAQVDTHYFRTAKNFAWYKGGQHHGDAFNAGTNGAIQMVINDGKVGIGTTNPTAGLEITTAGLEITPVWRCRTGPVAVLNKFVSSTGAKFKSELQIGDNIRIGGVTKRITEIQSDTQLAVETAFPPNMPLYDSYEILRTVAFFVSGGEVLLNGGNVGIGTDNPTQKLHVSGNVLANNVSVPSDARVKTNPIAVTPQCSLQRLLDLTLYEYEYAPAFQPETAGQKYHGFLAQEVEQVIPEAVSNVGDHKLSDGRVIDGLRAVAHERIFSETVGAIQALYQMLQTQAVRIYALEQQLAVAQAT